MIEEKPEQNQAVNESKRSRKISERGWADLNISHDEAARRLFAHLVRLYRIRQVTSIYYTSLLEYSLSPITSSSALQAAMTAISSHLRSNFNIMPSTVCLTGYEPGFVLCAPPTASFMHRLRTIMLDQEDDEVKVQTWKARKRSGNEAETTSKGMRNEAETKRKRHRKWCTYETC